MVFKFKLDFAALSVFKWQMKLSLGMRKLCHFLLWVFGHHGCSDLYQNDIACVKRGKGSLWLQAWQRADVLMLLREEIVRTWNITFVTSLSSPCLTPQASPIGWVLQVGSNPTWGDISENHSKSQKDLENNPQCPKSQKNIELETVKYERYQDLPYATRKKPRPFEFSDVISTNVGFLRRKVSQLDNANTTYLRSTSLNKIKAYLSLLVLHF